MRPVQRTTTKAYIPKNDIFLFRTANKWTLRSDSVNYCFQNEQWTLNLNFCDSWANFDRELWDETLWSTSQQKVIINISLMQSWWCRGRGSSPPPSASQRCQLSHSWRSSSNFIHYLNLLLWWHRGLVEALLTSWLFCTANRWTAALRFHLYTVYHWEKRHWSGASSKLSVYFVFSSKSINIEDKNRYINILLKNYKWIFTGNSQFCCLNLTAMALACWKHGTWVKT